MKKPLTKHGKTPEWNTSHFPSWSLQLIPIYSSMFATQDGTHVFCVISKPDSKYSISFCFLKLISLLNQLFADFCHFEKVSKTWLQVYNVTMLGVLEYTLKEVVFKALSTIVNYYFQN